MESTLQKGPAEAETPMKLGKAVVFGRDLDRIQVLRRSTHDGNQQEFLRRAIDLMEEKLTHGVDDN